MFIDDELDKRELESNYHLYLERVCLDRITRIMIIVENDTCYINTHRGYFVELPNNEYHKIMSYAIRHLRHADYDYTELVENCFGYYDYRSTWTLKAYLGNGLRKTCYGNDACIPRFYTKLYDILFDYYLDVDKDWFYKAVFS